MPEEIKAKFNKKVLNLTVFVESHKANLTSQSEYAEYFSTSTNIVDVELFDLRIWKLMSLKRLLASNALEKSVFVINNYRFFQRFIYEKDVFVIVKLKEELNLGMIDFNTLSKILVSKNLLNVIKDVEMHG